MTSQMILSGPEAKYVAKAIEAMRPEWNYAGILTALSEARHRANKWVVLLAAVHAASDPNNRTPAIIAKDGKHWPELRVPKTPPRIAALPELTPEEVEAAHAAYLEATQTLTQLRSSK